MRFSRQDINTMMGERILILDGATGTYLQQLNLMEEDFRGEKFKDHPTPLKGCNDVLCLTQPDKIIAMHRAYIEAGADIIETNSFNCNRYSLADYGLEDKVYEISKAAAQCAVKAISELNTSLPLPPNGRGARRVGLVAGSMGPTNKTCSMSADVNDPAAREVTFHDLYDTYKEQARGLIDGGADVLLIETIFDTLNAKAALKAITDLGKEKDIDIPVMVSATLSDASGRTLSGQTVEAFVASLQHGNTNSSLPMGEGGGRGLLSIGLNCGFGAKQLLPWLRRLSEISPYPVSVHPNAGLPNVMGGYDETPETFATIAKQVLEEKLVNIYGGCCGTTPLHINAIAKLAKGYKPSSYSKQLGCLAHSPHSTLSGLEPLSLDKNTGFINVGERTNVAGSAKFRKLIQAKDYEAALSVARQQVENGAQVIDVCMDDGMIDGIEAMTTFLNLIASEPEIARVPVMIDSSKWEILKAGLQCVQGKSIVNSISLKEGEEKFLEKAKYIHSMGAATVVMLFDENGQADTYERKVSVASRAYELLKGIGFPTEDIIFDPNVLAVATGMPEHDDYARAFIEACRTIHQEMPEVHLSGGISNLSFSFRGNNVIRQAIHSVFLYHAMQAGLDMSIVNPAMTTIYSEIPEDLLKVVEDVILNTDPGASERLLEYAPKVLHSNSESTPNENKGWREGSTKEKIAHAMLKGITDYIAEDTEEALREIHNSQCTTHNPALVVIDDYLMPAMEQVGKLFGEGKMFLPQVVKSARVMKKAVAVLEPYMRPTPTPLPLNREGKDSDSSSKGENTFNSPLPIQREGSGGGSLILMATVKGDVHDIGKNICGVVIQCNGYQVRDLGVMVDTETIVDTAQVENAGVIILSGLITPSLDEMIKVVRELQRRGMSTPVLLGGATTSAIHTAVKIAPEYPNGVVVHCRAAADDPGIIRKLLGEEREEFIAEIKAQQKIIRDNYEKREEEKKPLLSIEAARSRRHIKRVGEIAVPSPEAMKPIIEDVSISKVKDLIDWNFFYQAWGMHNAQCIMHNSELSDKSEEARKLMQDAQQMLREMEVQKSIRLSVLAHILPATSDKFDNINITCDGATYHLPMPRSLKDDGKETNCLADYICREGQDFICPFVVTAGIGLKALQARYRASRDEYKATMAKLLCDRLTEALATYIEKRVGWGSTGTCAESRRSIRMAFGYGACPDHKLKEPVFEMLKVKEHLPLTLTDSYMIDPGESICGLIFANTPNKYFNV